MFKKTLKKVLAGILVLLPVLLASQDVDLVFSHKYHAQTVGAECTDCHAIADTSTSSAHNLLPDMRTCYNCHDSETECSVCHKDPENAVVYPRITTYIANFSHARHLTDKTNCAFCHNGVAESESIFEQHLPTMSACVSCHRNREEADYCFRCHARQEDLEPKDHKLDWTQMHGIASHTKGDECETCHIESQCLDCHQGDDLDHRVHPLNFRNNHSLRAKGNSENCYTCHEEYSFCADCHRQELVLPRSHASAGWSNTENGGRHARDAKLDMDSCISCHNDLNSDLVCLQCHPN